MLQQPCSYCSAIGFLSRHESWLMDHSHRPSGQASGFRTQTQDETKSCWSQSTVRRASPGLDRRTDSRRKTTATNRLTVADSRVGRPAETTPLRRKPDDQVVGICPEI